MAYSPVSVCRGHTPRACSGRRALPAAPLRATLGGTLGGTCNEISTTAMLPPCVGSHRWLTQLMDKTYDRAWLARHHHHHHEDCPTPDACYSISPMRDGSLVHLSVLFDVLCDTSDAVASCYPVN
jgi:hypothetical protein